MLRTLIAIVLSTALIACSKPAHFTDAGGAPKLNETVEKADKYLAYEHNIAIEVDEGRIALVYEAGLAACRDASAELCTVLQARISTGKTAHGALKFRMKPDGIPKIIAALGKQADIIERSTSAEDLAGPIGDTAKKLAMLRDYRDKLQGLLGRASNDVDALIKVNRELAQVQSELEGLAGVHAALMQRVDTSTLYIDISSNRTQSSWRPIAQALDEFGVNLSQGTSSTITALAYLLPWALVLGALAWMIRKLWRRRKGQGR